MSAGAGLGIAPAIRLLIALVAGMAGRSAFADSFSFSYVFASTDLTLTGTFQGDQTGQFVQNITDFALTVNGASVGLPFFSAQMDDSGNWVGGPVMSFDWSLNNFAFADSDLASGDLSASHLFFTVNGSFGFGTYFESPEHFAADGQEYGPWTLTNLSTSPSSVPDHGLTAGMFLLTLAGLWLLRRQTAA